MIKSRIKVGHPARVFRYDHADEKVMQVQFARLCVLYDDLQLEFAAANEDAIPLLDNTACGDGDSHAVHLYDFIM